MGENTELLGCVKIAAKQAELHGHRTVCLTSKWVTANGKRNYLSNMLSE